MNSAKNVAAEIVQSFLRAEKILIVPHARPDGDAACSALALFLILQKMGKKNVRAVCADPIPSNLQFLPDHENFEQNDFFPEILKIVGDAPGVEIEKIDSRKRGENLEIEIVPRGGKFKLENFEIEKTAEKFDLIVSVDTADRQQLGSVFSKNPELFADNFVVNIDHHVSNEKFGNLNLIVPTAASTTEVIFSEILPELKKVTGKNFLDEKIATLLLCGIITDTGSFQNPNTTPKSFEIAADLAEAGARQQEIIRQIFKTKPLSQLKIWGRVLSKIKNEPVYRFVRSEICSADFQKASARSEELEGVLDTLLSNAPGAEVVLLLKEREDDVVSGSLRTTTPAVDATEIAKIFGGGGHRQAAGFKISLEGKSFDEIASFVAEKIRKFQATRLGLPRNFFAGNVNSAENKSSDSNFNADPVDKNSNRHSEISESKFQNRGEIPNQVRDDKFSPRGNSAEMKATLANVASGGVSKKMKAKFQNVARGKIENKNVSPDGDFDLKKTEAEKTRPNGSEEISSVFAENSGEEKSSKNLLDEKPTIDLNEILGED